MKGPRKLKKKRIIEGIELLNYRQKLVKMTDSYEHGWRVVQDTLQIRWPKIQKTIGRL